MSGLLTLNTFSRHYLRLVVAYQVVRVNCELTFDGRERASHPSSLAGDALCRAVLGLGMALSTSAPAFAESASRFALDSASWWMRLGSDTLLSLERKRGPESRKMCLLVFWMVCTDVGRQT